MKFHDDGEKPAKNEIFVFGSNLAGRHGAGSAKAAVMHYGARYGIGEGLQGRSYGIPTKGERLEILSLATIEGHVKQFIAFAIANPDKTFFVTRVGCGLAGYRNAQIAPLFRGAPENCNFAKEWSNFLS
jgi:hypothetical protein